MIYVERDPLWNQEHSDDYDPRPRTLQRGIPVLHVRANRNMCIIQTGIRILDTCAQLHG